MPGSSLVKCSSLSFSHVHIVIHCTQSSGRYDKWIRGWKVKRDRDRQKESKKRKEEGREESGRRGRRFFWFVFNPPKKTLPPFFFSTTPHKENSLFKQLINNLG